MRAWKFRGSPLTDRKLAPDGSVETDPDLVVPEHGGMIESRVCRRLIWTR